MVCSASAAVTGRAPASSEKMRSGGGARGGAGVVGGRSWSYGWIRLDAAVVQSTCGERRCDDGGERMRAECGGARAVATRGDGAAVRLDCGAERRRCAGCTASTAAIGEAMTGRGSGRRGGRRRCGGGRSAATAGAAAAGLHVERSAGTRRRNGAATARRRCGGAAAQRGRRNPTEPESGRTRGTVTGPASSIEIKRNQTKIKSNKQKFIEMPTDREKSPKNSRKSENL